MAIEMYEVTLTGVAAGQFCQTILNVNVNNVSGDNPFKVANDLLEEWNTPGNVLELFLDCVSESYSMLSARCRRILPTGGPAQIYLAASLSATDGTRAPSIATSSLAALFIWLTTTRPTKTGRTFLPALSETDVNNNVLQPGLLAAMTLFGDMYRDGGTISSSGDQWTGAIYRRALNASDDVTNYRVSPVVGNQRRRLRPYL